MSTATLKGWSIKGRRHYIIGTADVGEDGVASIYVTQEQLDKYSHILPSFTVSGQEAMSVTAVLVIGKKPRTLKANVKNKVLT